MKSQALSAATLLSITASSKAAEKKCRAGVSDTEQNAGRRRPPASGVGYSVIAKAQAAEPFCSPYD